MNLDIEIIFELTPTGENVYWVRLPGKEPMSLKDYMDKHLDKSDHEVIRQHIVIASRNYYNRFQSFLRDILMDKNNPMCVKFYSVKAEFQGRGAGKETLNKKAIAFHSGASLY